MSCIIENEELSFVSVNGETKLWLRKSNRYITMQEFYSCDLGDNVRFVFYVEEELQPAVKKKQIFKKQNEPKPFNTAIDYPKYTLNKPELIKLNLESEIKPKANEDYTDIAAAALGSLALIYSIINQAKQKKDKLEQTKCCTESKLNYEKLNAKIEKIIADNESNKKTLYAEVYEHYKELKELKEDTDNLKDVVSKIIDKI